MKDLFLSFTKFLLEKKIIWKKMCALLVNPLPNDKILGWFKFKAFADDKISDSKIEICVGKN